ncbi:MAG: carboxypeptidase-like regulatory domain-containing protein [Microscillaceae bacterium]|nr:carboxypeptidase-like regulatory domain-containing protein [Microscillaceae bacterium]
MRSIYITLLVLFSSLHGITAQELVLEGVVKDAKTQEPMPYVHVGVPKKNTGTITNTDGRFILRVPASYANETLKISFIGYQDFEQMIAQIQQKQQMEVLLVESALNLKEIIISAESPAQIVAKASEKIVDNYPQQNTLYTGFYRESNFQAPSNQSEKCYYIIEAVTKMNKPSYKNAEPQGDIKIEQVRKNQFVGDSTKFGKWVAGAFTPMRFDVAKKRMEFIDPKQQHKYNYQIDDYTTYYGRVVYIITFKPQKNSADYEGTLYIDMDTYAIVKADYQYTPQGLVRENYNRTHHSQLEKRQFVINYQPQDSLWYIESVWQQALAMDKISGNKVRYMTEYATTQIAPNQEEKFEYGDKIQWEEVFLSRNTIYDTNFWKNYNILAETEDLKENLINTSTQIAEVEKRQDNEKTTLTNKIPRFRPNIIMPSMGLIAVQNSGNLSVTFTNQESNFTFSEESTLASQSIAWGSGFGFEYDIYRNTYISFLIYQGFNTKQDIGSFQLGVGNRWLLSKPKKRPVFLALGLDFSLFNFKYKIGEYSINEDISIEGTAFEEDKIVAHLRQRKSIVMPKIAIQVELNRRLVAFVELSVPISFQNREDLLLADKNNLGWLGQIGQSRKSISLDSPSVEINRAGNQINELPFKQPLLMSIGVKGYFRFF